VRAQPTVGRPRSEASCSARRSVSTAKTSPCHEGAKTKPRVVLPAGFYQTLGRARTRAPSRPWLRALEALRRALPSLQPARLLRQRDVRQKRAERVTVERRYAQRSARAPGRSAVGAEPQDRVCASAQAHAPRARGAQRPRSPPRRVVVARAGASHRRLARGHGQARSRRDRCRDSAGASHFSRGAQKRARSPPSSPREGPGGRRPFLRGCAPHHSPVRRVRAQPRSPPRHRDVQRRAAPSRADAERRERRLAGLLVTYHDVAPPVARLIATGHCSLKLAVVNVLTRFPD